MFEDNQMTHTTPYTQQESLLFIEYLQWQIPFSSK